MRTLSVVGVLSLVPAALPAQESLVAVGARVRVTTTARENLEGTVTAWRGDTMVLRATKGLLTEVPIGEVSSLSVVRGRRPNPLGGAVKGMLVGGGAGVAVFSAICGEADIDPGPGDSDPGACSSSDAWFLLMGTGAAAVAGGVVGLVAGTIVGADRWRPVATPATRLSVRPLSGGGLGVGFSLRF